MRRCVVKILLLLLIFVEGLFRPSLFAGLIVREDVTGGGRVRMAIISRFRL
jgi:hypothetical protein